MADESSSSEGPKFSAEIIKERFQTMAAWLKQASAFADKLDWLGDAEKHPTGSDGQKLAYVRDEVDFALSKFIGQVSTTQRIRAETTRCLDLLVDAANDRLGDGQDALHLMRRYHALFGDEMDEDGETPPETFPDFFAWDAYLRVSALPDLVKKFPKHLQHSARQMHGWPIIVSHHLDCRPEFERVADLLEIGTDYPLDVGPRKRRGAETPLLQYLEPKLWQVHVCRKVLREARVRDGTKADKWRPDPDSFFSTLDPEPTSEAKAILHRAPHLPPLTKKTAGRWSREVLVPLIMLKDAGTAETCEIPALRNIWQHRSVKSRATFQSRLHSAVTDTLKRFGRPG